MKIIALLIFTITIGLNLYGQNNPTEEAKPIVEEGKRLYKSEMASWYGTDLFLEKYENRENIGGYFSYTVEDTSKCIFFSRSDDPKVIGTISFDSTFNTEKAQTDFKERRFSTLEQRLFEMRSNAFAAMQTDTIFKTYKNTNLNVIPLIYNGQKKVYVLTGPQVTGVVIIGNDYLITFGEKNKVVGIKQLHKNIIPINYGDESEEGMKAVGAIHSHLPETGDFITATDICTLMLYAKYANWKTHTVVSDRYLNLWNCETNTLTVVPRDTLEKIDKSQKKSKKKSKKPKSDR